MRTKQREHRLFFRVEADVASADDPQMPWPKVINRSTIAILVDHRWAHVRGARNGRRIAEPFSDGAHHGRHYPFRLSFRLGESMLGKRDCGNQRPAPRPEILGRELL